MISPHITETARAGHMVPATHSLRAAQNPALALCVARRAAAAGGPTSDYAETAVSAATAAATPAETAAAARCARIDWRRRSA